MTRVTRLALGALALPMIAGCAGGNFWMRNGAVAIRTSPEGATATSEHGDSCTTPCRLRIRTARGGEIRISKAGYEDEAVRVTSSHDPVGPILRTAGHLIDPDPVSIAIDAAFMLLDPGHDRRLDTRRLDISLTPSSPFLTPPIQPASLAPLGPGIVRLPAEEVDAILGPPIATARGSPEPEAERAGRPPEQRLP